MSRSTLMMTLILRGPVHAILWLVGRIALLVGLVFLVLAMAGDSFMMLVYGLVGLSVWHCAFCLRFRYDTEVL
jgi:hypothetical protein